MLGTTIRRLFIRGRRARGLGLFLRLGRRHRADERPYLVSLIIAPGDYCEVQARTPRSPSSATKTASLSSGTSRPAPTR